MAELGAGNGWLLAHCAIGLDRGVSCWGAGRGEAWNAQDATPFPISNLSGVKHVADADWHSCAEVDDGGLWCWGENERGEVALGTTYPNWVYPPAKAQFVPPFAGFACSGGQCCVIDLQSDVWCWGRLHITRTDLTPTPTRIEGVGGRAIQVAPGANHVCVLRDDDVAVCWGANESGQLGDGTTVDRATPVPVVAL